MDIVYKRALVILQAGNKKQLKKYLDEQEESLKSFADKVFEAGIINQKVWEQIVGENMPDPELKAFEDQLNAQQISLPQLIDKHGEPEFQLIIEEYIKNQLDQKTFGKEEVASLSRAGIIGKHQLDLYCESKGWNSGDFVRKDSLAIPPSVWPTDLDLTFGHTDVLLVGAPYAGKTMFLSLFYHYARRKLGKLEILSNNSKGSKYSSIIMQAVEDGQFIDSTPNEVILSTSCKLSETTVEKGFLGIRKKQVDMPFNCIEISGESFRDAYGKPLDEWPRHLQKVFQSENPLILVILLPSDESTITINEIDHSIRISTEDFLNYIIGSLQQEPEINGRLVATSIVISKWDELSSTDQSAEDVVSTRCPQMHAKLKQDYEEMYGLFPFSVGHVNKELNSFQYKHETIREWYDWLIQTAPVSP